MRVVVRMVVGLALVLLGTLAVLAYMTVMPGRSLAGDLPPVSDAERSSAQRIGADLRILAVDIGERNFLQYEELILAAEFLEKRIKGIGLVSKRRYVDVDSRPFFSIEAVVLPGNGSADPIIFGAHYDSAVGTSGADDNASGVAVALELAQLLADYESRHPVHVAFFVNEEPPYFRTPSMGSLEYARQLTDEGIQVAAMLSLESLGYFSSEAGSQKYPSPLNYLYPDRGDFVAFVGNVGSRSLVRQAIQSFRGQARFPSEGIAAPSFIPGIGWSDHWSFWLQGVPAIMVTDTAPYRNPNYHVASDTIDTVDIEAMARIAHGLRAVVSFLDQEL